MPNYSYIIYKAQSSSLASKSKLSLPTWASWDWDQKYLPHDVHIDLKEFDLAVGLLRDYEFDDCDKGIVVILGFGLLLRECWRAVEVERDDEDSPKYLRESLLDIEGAEKVIKAIEEVTNRLRLATGEKTSEEKNLHDAKGKKKAKAGRKKQRTPSPPPSISRPSGTGKRDNSPVRNTRSQRQRKPSKKVLDAYY